MTPSREREISLIVTARTPERTLRSIAALRTLDGIGLRRRGAVTIQDVYLDTPEGEFARRRIALRTRRVSGAEHAQLITLKGPTRLGAGRVGQREEFERPFDRRTLQRVLEEASRQGVRLQPRRGSLPAAMNELPGSLGLVAVQHRTTRRTLIDVYRGRPRRRVAELALDRTTYRWREGRARIFEIEIEAKGTGTTADVAAIATALRHRFPDDVKPWRYSKLATGRELERAARTGRLASWSTPAGTLAPSAVRQLERRLARRP